MNDMGTITDYDGDDDNDDDEDNYDYDTITEYNNNDTIHDYDNNADTIKEYDNNNFIFVIVRVPHISLLHLVTHVLFY